MKKSDVLTLLGIVSGFGMIIWGMLGEAGLSDRKSVV